MEIFYDFGWVFATRIRIRFIDADPDPFPADQNETDPDPQQFLKHGPDIRLILQDDEDIEAIELGNKMVLLMDILRECELIGDKVKYHLFFNLMSGIVLWS